MSEPMNGFDSSIVDEKASKVGPAGIDIAYQRFGNPDAPVVLLIMGVAAQLIHWPDAFCHALVEGGLQVIRFDNRDIRALHAPDGCPASRPARGAGRRPVVGVIHAVGYGCRRGGIAGRARLQEGTCRRRVHGRRDCANDGDRASGPCPLSHLDDVDDGQHVSRAALAGGAARSVQRPARNHPRRSDSADAPGFPRGRLARISERTRRKSPREQAAPTTAATIRSASLVRRSRRSLPAIAPNACGISRSPPS